MSVSYNLSICRNKDSNHRQFNWKATVVPQGNVVNLFYVQRHVTYRDSSVKEYVKGSTVTVPIKPPSIQWNYRHVGCVNFMSQAAGRCNSDPQVFARTQQLLYDLYVPSLVYIHPAHTQKKSTSAWFCKQRFSIPIQGLINPSITPIQLIVHNTMSFGVMASLPFPRFPLSHACRRLSGVHTRQNGANDMYVKQIARIHCVMYGAVAKSKNDLIFRLRSDLGILVTIVFVVSFGFNLSDSNSNWRGLYSPFCASHIGT